MWKNKLLLEDKLVSSSAGMWFCRACNKGPFSKVFAADPRSGKPGWSRWVKPHAEGVCISEL